MSFLISDAHAQAPAGGAAPAGGGLSFFVLIFVMFALMYFMMIRPQQKRQKEHRAMLSALSKGDEVLTNGGVAGRVTDLGESFISVEIADNVVVKVQKGAVSQVLPKGTLKSA
jgi:preprotein translocase subunit YajC